MAVSLPVSRAGRTFTPPENSEYPFLLEAESTPSSIVRLEELRQLKRIQWPHRESNPYCASTNYATECPFYKMSLGISFAWVINLATEIFSDAYQWPLSKWNSVRSLRPVFCHLVMITSFFSSSLFPFGSTGPISQFIDHSQTVGLLGRVISSSQGLYLDRGQ
jgi:hypothetical protein